MLTEKKTCVCVCVRASVTMSEFQSWATVRQYICVATYRHSYSYSYARPATMISNTNLLYETVERQFTHASIGIAASTYANQF